MKRIKDQVRSLGAQARQLRSLTSRAWHRIREFISFKEPGRTLLSGIHSGLADAYLVASSIPESKVKPFASPINPSHIYWDDLIERGCPFIKRELLLKNPFGVDILNWPGRVSRRSTEALRDIALYFMHKLESISFLYNTSHEYARQFIFEDLGIVRAKRNSGFDSIIDAAGLAWAPLFYPSISIPIPISRKGLLDKECIQSL